jgi:hypothetical protein
LAYDNVHGKFWQDIKADVDKTRARARKFSGAAEWAFGKKTARVLGVLALFGVVVILLFLLLNLYVDPTKPSGKKDLVLAVAQILAGMALLSGLYFTWRSLQVSRAGQITERFTRAIDQLGAVVEKEGEWEKNLEVRLGGIYSLERTAYEDLASHRAIMQVLTTYVREHAPWLSTRDEPEPDIQAILTVIGRRSEAHRDVEYGTLNLSETNLRGANLWKAYFRKAYLQKANLKGAYLSRANLKEADLSDADLSDADLTNADLSDADLRRTNLRRAKRHFADGAKPPEPIANEELWQQTKALEGATMPDGQKYEDWLKDREAPAG